MALRKTCANVRLDLNKKSRVIMIVSIIVLAIAAAMVLYFTMRNGGAKQIEFDQFVEYVENGKYSEFADGVDHEIIDQKKTTASGAEVTGPVYAAWYKDGGEVKKAENHGFFEGKLQTRSVDKDGKDIWEDAVVIKVISFSEYKMYGSIQRGGNLSDLRGGSVRNYSAEAGIPLRLWRTCPD